MEYKKLTEDHLNFVVRHYTGTDRFPNGILQTIEILGVTVEHLDMDSGAAQGIREEKLKIIRGIRQFRPELSLPRSRSTA